MDNPLLNKSIKELYKLGCKKLAYWKACPFRLPNSSHKLLLKSSNYPLGCFVHLLK